MLKSVQLVLNDYKGYIGQTITVTGTVFFPTAGISWLRPVVLQNCFVKENAQTTTTANTLSKIDIANYIGNGEFNPSILEDMALTRRDVESGVIVYRGEGIAVGAFAENNKIYFISWWEDNDISICNCKLNDPFDMINSNLTQHGYVLDQQGSRQSIKRFFDDSLAIFVFLDDNFRASSLEVNFYNEW